MRENFDYTTAPELIRVENLHKDFGSLKVLSGITETIHKGEVVSLIGASGSGKSTLLHLLGTLDRATSGKIFFEGRDLSALDEAQAAHFRNRELGFVFQFHHLLPEFTTVENVAMQAVIAGMPKAKALKLAEESLERVGLEHRRDHHVSTLSGGERQRAAIARATLLCPKVLLADEPTGNLDEKTGSRVVEVLRELNREMGMTLIIVTHNRELAASLDRCLELRSGELYAQTSF